MRYRIFNSENFYYELGDPVKPLEEKSDLIVAFDPGKTNMAVVVGTVTGQVKAIFEFGGKDINDKTMDTTDYCWEVVRFMKDVLAGSRVFLFGQEEAILPNKYGKDKTQKQGMAYFTSNMVLTEIRANLINLSMELSNKKPIQVNNWAWKKAILPDGYRGQNEKGSKRYIADVNPMFANYSHDVTDVLCIYQYLVQKYTKDITIYCDRIETTNYEYNINIVDRSVVPSDVKFFRYSEHFTCEQNAIYFVNHCNSIGACEVKLEDLSMEDIYSYAFNLQPDSKLYMLVSRK